MKTTQLTLIAIVAFLAACSTAKKTVTPAVSPATSATNSASRTKSVNGIYAPGAEELAAIQAQHPDVTLERLNEGYVLYAQGACVKCHGAMNIYDRDAVQWKQIIDVMAVKARISDVQKDAVYKYVLAIKAARPGQ